MYIDEGSALNMIEYSLIISSDACALIREHEHVIAFMLGSCSAIADEASAIDAGKGNSANFLNLYLTPLPW